MPIAPEGIKVILSILGIHLAFLLGALLVPTVGPAATAVKWVLAAAAGLFALLTVFSLYFFRDPDREIPVGDKLVVSPADGRVLGVERLDTAEYVNGPVEKVSIFMNVFDVHVNRAPVAGAVEYRDYRPGKFLNASLDKASADNESMTLGIRTPGGTRVLVRQIAGLVARRIACRVEPGDSLERGERFGLIRFGSRLEVFLPVGVDWRVHAGQKVTAGATVLAEITE